MQNQYFQVYRRDLPFRIHSNKEVVKAAEDSLVVGIN